MKERLNLKKVNFNGKTLFQLKVGQKPDFTVWVSPKLVTQIENEYFLELPIGNVKVVRGRKNLIFLPGDKNLFNIYVRYGDKWQGWKESSITIETCPCEILAYERYINHHAMLVLTDSPYVEYRWKKAKGQIADGSIKIEEGFGIVHLDGTAVEVDGEKDDAFASLE